MPAKAISQPQHFVNRKLRKTEEYTPANAIPSNLATAGGSIDIRIPRGSADGSVESVFLRLQLTETGGSNSATPALAPFLVQEIEWYANGGATRVQTMYAESIYLSLAFMNDESQQHLLNVMNMDANFGTPSAISASASATYYIPLVGCWLDTAAINLHTLQGDVVCRVKFPTVGSKASGSGTLSIADVSLLIESEISEEGEKHKANVIRGFYHSHFVDFQLQTFSQALAAATTVKKELSGIKGRSFLLWSLLRSSTENTANQYGFTNPVNDGTLELQDSIGKPIQGNSTYAKTNQYLRFVEPAKHAAGNLVSDIAVVPLFIGDAVEAIHTGALDGYLYFTGNEQLAIKPGTGFSSATYRWTIVANVMRELTIKNGRVEVMDY